MRKLPDDPAKRRVQYLKRIYQHLEHFRELMESGQMELPGVVTLPDGEEIYLDDLMAGIDSLPPRQRQAFELICLQGYTETDTTKIMLPNSRWSTPCFSGDTKFVTAGGTKTLREVVNTEQKVVGKWGGWTAADIKSFGQQPLCELKICRGAHQKSIWATAGHRWFLEDGSQTTTKDLIVGRHLLGVFDDDWEVVSVKLTDRTEEVFCAVVPDGEAFVLDGDIITGNCQQYADSALARMIQAYDERQAGTFVYSCYESKKKPQKVKRVEDG